MRQIAGAVLGVGQVDFFQSGLLAADHLHQRLWPVQQGAAEFGETDIAPAGDQVVGQPDNFLIFPFVADFRPAEHDFQVGSRQFELADNFRRRRHIPDINPEADDLRAAIRRITQLGKQRFDNLRRRPGNGEFAQHGAGAQLVAAVTGHVGQQITQAQRGVNVFGVERAQDDRGWSVQHPAILTSPRRSSAAQRFAGRAWLIAAVNRVIGRKMINTQKPLALPNALKDSDRAMGAR